MARTACVWDPSKDDPVVYKDIAPGDWCPMDQEENPCFFGSTCVKNVCVRPVEDNISCCASDGEGCTDKYCPPGQYCEATDSSDDKYKMCQPIKEIGEVCARDNQCGYGAFCNYVEYTDEPRTCKFYGTLKNGEAIGRVDNPLHCESGQSFPKLVYRSYIHYCMRGRVSEPGYEMGTNFPNEQGCNYRIFQDDVIDGLLQVEPARCGFNQDTNYYCPVWKGDPVYLDFYARVFQYLRDADSTHTCNEKTALIGPKGTPRCAALADKINNDKFYEELVQVEWLVQSPTGYPNIANNADCVKSVLTKGYWQSSDSIYHQYVTLLAIMLAIFSY